MAKLKARESVVHLFDQSYLVRQWGHYLTARVYEMRNGQPARVGGLTEALVMDLFESGR